MNLKSRIPQEFYKLFASKYLDYYMAFLTAVYQESSRSYSVLGLMESECRAIINERLADFKIDWSQERVDEEGALLSKANMAGVCLSHFEAWGWVKSDYDETLNCNVISFPEYSQLFLELFEKLLSPEDSQERESILAVYSYLYTYRSDKEKDGEILKSALSTSKRLGQLLSNMQEGMRSYFDELSKQKDFRGIQEVLVNEINNQDSQKYAILTTTDSFYRYKEAVKELMEDILEENEARREKLRQEHETQEPGTAFFVRSGRGMALCDEAAEIVGQIEREFDAIERKYNKLIEQKTVFASRAAARIRYILQEGAGEEDKTLVLVNLLNKSARREEILQDLKGRLGLSASYRVLKESSLYSRREREQSGFQPSAVRTVREDEPEQLEEFILKPLYTKAELRQFMEQNMENGTFTAREDTIQSAEDLEKLLFLWQEAAEQENTKHRIRIGEDISTPQGYSFSGLVIEEDTDG